MLAALAGTLWSRVWRSSRDCVIVRRPQLQQRKTGCCSVSVCCCHCGSPPPLCIPVGRVAAGRLVNTPMYTMNSHMHPSCTHAAPHRLPPTRTHPHPQPLDKLQRAELTKEAAQYVAPGFKLVMAERVDTGLLGGFILEFEDRLVDMSARKKLEEFNNLVRAAAVLCARAWL